MTSKTTQAAELAAVYAESRHRVLAENLANIDTPGYRSQVLDPTAFQKSLQTALERTPGNNDATLELRGDAQCSTDVNGHLKVTPAAEPAPNVLFHDGTNAKLERLVTDINDNALYYEMSTNLLRGRYQTMLAAIRGRVT